MSDEVVTVRFDVDDVQAGPGELTRGSHDGEIVFCLEIPYPPSDEELSGRSSDGMYHIDRKRDPFYIHFTDNAVRKLIQQAVDYLNNKGIAFNPSTDDFDEEEDVEDQWWEDD